MQGTITITLNDNRIAQISANENPELFVDLIGAANTGRIGAVKVVSGGAAAKDTPMEALRTEIKGAMKQGYAAYTEGQALALAEADRLRRGSPKKPSSTKKSGTKKSAADVRTVKGREELDEELKELLGGEDWKRLEHIKLRGTYTPYQLRESARRLVEAGILRRRGQARATEYAGR
jgi:hypothetical protein